MIGSALGPRASGLLLHITSLPSDYGIGDVGPRAHQFAAQLAAAGQRYWQVLPVGPTGRGNSPYSSSSTFAGNPLLISLDLLRDVELVDEDELVETRLPETGRVDYDRVRQQKSPVLRRAARRFTDRADAPTLHRYEQFTSAHGPLWLDDFCRYTARRESGRLDRTEGSSSELSAEVEIHRVTQFLFYEQWQGLKEACHSHGVEIVGDIPLYVALDSADVWSHPDNYLLDVEGKPNVVAGVPPDYFSDTGQNWGNPIFDWAQMARDDYSWWRERVRHALDLFDLLRIDHFRGIAGYWEIPATETTAIEGRWRTGPGASLMRALQDELGSLPFIAEDLGVITDDVIALRDEFGLPGMRVAQFGFDRAPDTSLHHPKRYPENVWAYTGTHDNNTTLGWFWEGNPSHDRTRLADGRRKLYRAVAGDIPGGLVAMVARSKAGTVVFPVQDLLALGPEARMNTPGIAYGNWEWRLGRGQLTEEALGWLHRLTADTGRLSD